MTTLIEQIPLRSRFPEAFNRDYFALEEVHRLILKHGIELAIETGTAEGKTAEALYAMCGACRTIELIFPAAHLNWHRWDRPEFSELHQILGDSESALPSILRNERIPRPTLFYLDAHWTRHSPLMGELKAIARWMRAAGTPQNGDGKRRPPGLIGSEYRPAASAPPAPVIVIHDFKNPLHPEFGWDCYDIGPHAWPTISTAIYEIYGLGGYEIHYNDEAAGSMKGIIYIEPRHPEDRGRYAAKVSPEAATQCA